MGISLFGATIEQMVVLAFLMPIPAFPPIEATIGIKKANTTICSMVAPNKLIHHVARKAVNKLSKSQLNLLFVFFTTPSVISSSPTPANLKASSSSRCNSNNSTRQSQQQQQHAHHPLDVSPRELLTPRG